MRGEEILHVVPTKEGLHALYTRDGRIITIKPSDGTVMDIAELPAVIESPKPPTYRSRSAQITPG